MGRRYQRPVPVRAAAAGNAGPSAGSGRGEQDVLTVSIAVGSVEGNASGNDGGDDIMTIDRLVRRGAALDRSAFDHRRRPFWPTAWVAAIVVLLIAGCSSP